MTIRITGMNSGLDTDAIIKELVSAYRAKGDKTKKQQTKLSWTQDKWKSLNAKVLNLYKSLDSLRFTAGYNMKKTSVSDATKATVTAGKGAVNGTQKLKVDQVANGGYLTGAEIKAKKGAATKLSDLDGWSGSGEIRLTGNGKDTYLKVDENTTIDDFVKQVNNSGAGVQASYDETNKRLFIVSKETGADNDFMLAATDENGANALYAMGISTQSKTGSAEAKSWIENYVSGGAVDRAALERDVKAAADAKKAKEAAAAEKERLLGENKDLQGAVNYVTAAKNIKDVNQTINDNDATALSHLANMSDSDREKEYEVDAAGNPVLDADGNLVEATASSANKEKGSAIYDNLKNVYNITNEDTDEFKQIKSYNANKAAVEKYEDEHQNDPNNYILGSGDDPAAKLAEYNQKITDNNAAMELQDEELAKQEEIIQSYKTIDGAGLTSALADMNVTDQDFKDYVDGLEKKVTYFKDHYTKNASGEWQLNNTNDGAYKEDGKNAMIHLNGAKFESTTNTFNINGLSIQALSTTSGSEEVTITTATDTQGLYDKIKDFISEYNSIINEMSSLYNADSAKGYEPLTSEEKEALSESEVADWEKKIKDSLLRRDSNLSTLMNVMTSAMSKSFDINGKSYSLSSLGIKTGSYFKTTAKNRYELHIDGDPDDETTSANADKLMSMLNSDPDTVISLIQGVANELSDKLGKQMKPSTMRSYQSIYNDKAMAQSYSDYTKKISAWEQKVTEIEDSYYKKFAAMETALAKLQSQQSAFAGMLGS